ncbi:DNA internalization-related competence protein ComEC/Rec2 [Microbulbifer salipaludis]|uniref:DNA internalization-related competence protein ComEC/Rec2 n=1 Tax=Microbulbifer salipaludis TaxID=187980 RepID=A0ABS3E8P9_9GAMM|nr:DNA internalization-related competence protein ComEC/Rec2 [Microbulbifer salipaludis]MBN8431689.1 DNA internalization-related competence protein ComEC/Rec2 [Microbulbifer salipaludis]
MNPAVRTRVPGALWACAVGIGQVAFWPRLPGTADLAGGALLALGAMSLLALTSRNRAHRGRWQIPVVGILLPFLLGTCWGLQWNHRALEQRLPPELHGTDHDVRVELMSLVHRSPAASRFGPPAALPSGYQDARFRARIIHTDDPRLHNRTLQLGWYRVAPADAARLTTGSRWQMRVRLKEPRGSVNPHTFDYEAWLLEQGLFATGYVRDRDQLPVHIAAGSGVGALRDALRRQLSHQTAEGAGYTQASLIRALLLGDRSGIDTPTKTLLQRTGTAHLLAISGLHVGMVAGAFFLFGWFFGRLFGAFTGGRWCSPLTIAGFAALSGALGYTLISGAPLSAQRALLMTAVAMVALLCRRRMDGQLTLALAVCGVLLWQPLAVLNAGFWLSFIAVGALLLRFQGRLNAGVGGTPVETSARPAGAGKGGARRLAQVLCTWLVNGVRSQWAIFLGLLVPSVLIFHGISLSGLLINLVAIPWVGLSILPLILLGALCPLLPLKTLLWTLADLQLSWLLALFGWLDGLAPGWQVLPVPGPWVTVLLVLSALALLLPKGVPGRGLGLLCFPVIAVGATPWQRPAPATFELSVLDVGQGLAVTATTAQHTVIFDTGASTARGWSAGAGIVAPYLRARGRPSVDGLIVSHGDRDHAGGAAGVMAMLAVDQLFAPGRLGQRLSAQAAADATGPPPLVIGTQPCVAGSSVQFGELAVRWMWPLSPALNGEENDHSCVGLLTWRDTRVLLTGDISRRVEARLAALYPDFAPVDVLVAPHHGSRTSSSPALLAWAAPQRVVFSAGYRHHFGHPHPQVVSRYRALGAQLFNTAELGAVEFQWREQDDAPSVQCARGVAKFWRASDGGASACMLSPVHPRQD